MNDAQLFAGIDVGGTKINAILASHGSAIEAQSVFDTQSQRPPELTVAEIAEVIKRLVAETGKMLSAVAIGLPGCVDPVEGRVIFMPNMGKQWQGFPARQALQSLVNVPVFIANDARMATLGEYTYGNHPASRDMLMVTVGTGIGGGLVLDGKLRLGTYGAAGELGHHVVLIDGPECSCGGRGCLEAIVSGPALARRGAELVRSGQAPILSGVVDGRSQAVTTREMAIAARAGDKAVAEAIRTCARYLGIGIANAISIAAVDRVVLTGGVVSLGDLLLDPVRIAVREHVRMFPPDKIEIVPSTLGENTGALGCVAFAAEQSRD